MRKARLSIGVIALGLVVLLGLAIVGLWKELTTPAVRELPGRKINRIFKMVAGHKLPKSVDDIRSVFWDSRDPAIFVRFKTDAEGIAYIKEVFGGPGVVPEVLDTDEIDRLRESGWKPFWPLSRAEAKLGIHLFDMGSLKRALWLTRAPKFDAQPGYDILIDIENNTVYMKALRL